MGDVNAESLGGDKVPDRRRLYATLVLAVLVLETIALGWSLVRSSRNSHDGIVPSSTDYEIFDIVLADLIENPELNPGYHGPQIIIGLTTAASGLSDTKLSRMLPDLGSKISVEVRADLVLRNPRGRECSLARYRPANPNILVHELTDREWWDFHKEFPTARAYITATFPGYSPDGHTACFVFGYGPDDHVTSGCYLLSKVKGRWEVIGRHLFHSS